MAATDKERAMLTLVRALAVLLFAAALPAAAQELPKLTIYTYDSFASEWGPGPQLKTGFEKTCVCSVEFVATDSSIGALRRVQLEGDTTSADIVLGLDTSIAGEARATGLFTPHGLDLSALALPAKWADAEFVPFDFGYFAFVYDTDLVVEPPASFAELITKPQDFKIVIEDPRSDTPGLGLLLWIKAAYGDGAAAIWRGLKPHLLTVARSWSDAYALFLKGEADMVLSYTTSPAYHAIAEDDPSYAAAEFAEGLYPQIEVAGILKSSPNLALAAQFLSYLTSPEAQAVIPTTNWMYPVVNLGAALPAAFAALPTPAKILGLDEATITANKDAWIEEALAAIQ
jgi:thiamine transport system substrate-binding protein